MTPFMWNVFKRECKNKDSKSRAVEKVISALNATVDEVYWKLHTTVSTQRSFAE
jgi:hypothetical protein